MVVTPLDDTPAHRAGLRRGDVIRKVNGDATLGITVLQAVDMITGPAGTNVTLSIERPGREDWFDVTLTRAEIPIYSVKGWRRTGVHETDWDWFVDQDNRIGYVRVNQFSEDTTDQLDRALAQMRANGLNALIVDLRYNPGGLLTQAVSIANRFVSEGVIVSQHDAAGIQTDAESARPGLATLQDIPVAILINEGSASASEIVAGAVQDYARLGEIDAILVGARTYGKGSVQNLHDLSRGTAILKLTERYYHLPDGRLIHRKPGSTSWGVDPDVEVAMLPSQMSDAIELRDSADILPGQVDENGDPPPDPQRLLTEGIDPQLETAVLLLKARVLGRTSGHAMLTPEQPAPVSVSPAGGL
jgi:carboxyl-terminal processing protease